MYSQLSSLLIFPLVLLIQLTFLKGVNSDGALFTAAHRFRESSYFTFWSTDLNDNSSSDHTTASQASNCSSRSSSRKVIEIKVPISDEDAKLYSTLPQLDQKLSRCGKRSENAGAGIEIRELTISHVQNYFQSKKLFAVELTICYLRRISKMNSALRAVIEVNPDAIKLALKTDLERAMGINRGLLHGIPILIKDNIATGDAMETTAGSLALKGMKPVRDARVVKRLRAAGAVILGKANLSEFANFRGTNMPDGWSGRGGQTVCPYNSSADPNGSSSGPAVAVSANLAMAALGTETDGSIASPSSRQSVVGLKTTLGLISTDGVIPLAPSQDVVGPMTRTAADGAIILQEISEEGHKLGKCGINLEDCFLEKHFRVGVVREPYWNETVDSVLRKESSQLQSSLEALVRTGKVTLIDPVTPKVGVFEKVSPDYEFTTFLHEFKEGINSYLHEMVENNGTNAINSLADIIQFNELNPNVLGYNQLVLLMSEGTDGVQNSTYKYCRDINKEGAKEFLDYLFQNYNCDLLVGPSEEDLNSPLIFSMAAIAGYPSITVPAGFTDFGVPFGITFVGRAYAEMDLLKIGSLLETSHPVRKAPLFLSAP